MHDVTSRRAGLEEHYTALCIELAHRMHAQRLVLTEPAAAPRDGRAGVGVASSIVHFVRPRRRRARRGRPGAAAPTYARGREENTTRSLPAGSIELGARCAAATGS